MSTGTPSAPVRFLQGQHASDTRNLLLPVFSGQVFARFDSAAKFLPLVNVRRVGPGQSWAVFYKTGLASARYHTPGIELLGGTRGTTEIRITADDVLVSDFAVSDLDVMLSHFDVRQQFAEASGNSLARETDKNIARMLILASRASADGEFLGGETLTDASLTKTGAIDGKAWVDGFREIRIKADEKNVPSDTMLYGAVNPRVFDAIRFAQDAKGNYMFPADATANRPESLDVAGIKVFWTNNLPTADESSTLTVYPKYRANYSTTTGVVWASDAIGVTMVMDITYETTRDVRRQEDFTVYKMLSGCGIVRPELAWEIKTS